METSAVDENEVPCEFCDQLIKSQFYKTHVELCPRNPYRTNQDKSGVPCEVCNEEIPFDKYDAHVKSHTQQSAGNDSNQRRSNSQENQRPFGSTQIRQNNFDEEKDNEDLNSVGNRVNQHGRRVSPNSLLPGEGPELNPLSTLFNGGRPQQVNSDHFGRGFQQFLGAMLRDRPVNIMEPSSRRMQVISGPGGTTIIRLIEGPNQGGEPNFRGSRQMPHQIGELDFGDIFRMLMTRVSSENPGENSDMDDLLEGLGLRRPEEGFKKEDLDRNFITFKFNKANSVNLDPEYKACSICLDDFKDGDELRILECCHRFHSNCIDGWMKSHTTCPICKKDFKNFQAE